MIVSDRGTLILPEPHSENGSYVRLHVTPLDVDLLKVVLSSALLPKARNISYHTIETFPEKRYGFLELPNEDAEKLRKKLNGSVLKGVKIRIERARPSAIPAPLGEAAMAKEKSSKKSAEGTRPPKDKNKKRKRDAEELSGVLLEEGRKIKRGWTTADEPVERRSKKDKDKKNKKEKKKQAKSKYTSYSECLVKTVLPANAMPIDAEKKKKKGKSREVIIHEFEKTTKFPTFLRTAAATARSSGSLQFVDGKGWVDEDGNVVEAVKTGRPPPARSEDDRHQEETIQEAEDTASESDDSFEGTGEPDSSELIGNQTPASKAANFSEPVSSPSDRQQRPKSSGSVRNLSIKIPPATPDEPKVMHPLEALYKRPKQPDGEAAEAAPDAQGFSFFANGNEESAGEDGDEALGDVSGIQLPMTPFTRRDFELRGIRSAAPTPDTAHPSRRFKPWGEEEEEDDEDGDGQQDDRNPASEGYEDGEETDLANGGGQAAPAARNDDKPTSDFQKWFWENRGDLNRSWKKRRKLAGKEKRYRENRARMARAI